MSDQITEDHLKEALVARLGATHVEMEDISGTYPTLSAPRGTLDTWGRTLSLLWPAPSSSQHFSILHSPYICHPYLAFLPNPPLPHFPPLPRQLAPSILSQAKTNKNKGGCGQAFKAKIVSPQFAGLNSLKRHRLVNAALKDEIGRIHAWSAKCQTPEEFAR